MNEMPKYVKIGNTCVHFESYVKDKETGENYENLAWYYRDAGNWSIRILRRPTGELVCLHSPPFPEDIGEAKVIEISKDEYRKEDWSNII